MGHGIAQLVVVSLLKPTFLDSYGSNASSFKQPCAHGLLQSSALGSSSRVVCHLANQLKVICDHDRDRKESKVAELRLQL